MHGLFAYLVGDAASRLSTPVQIMGGILIVLLVLWILRFLKRNEKHLEELAMNDERTRHA